MIRAVISDFGGVLTSPLTQSFMAYQRESGIAIEDLGKAMAQVMADDGGRHPLFELEKGNITEADFLGRIGEALGRPLESFRETYFAHLEPNEPMIEFLRGLRGDGMRMALLTNNVREWEPLWRAKLPDIDAIFEVIVDSAFVGMRKPEPGIYSLTLERLGLEAADCAFVDDVEINCDAARQLGMAAVHFRDTDQAISDLRAVLNGG